MEKEVCLVSCNLSKQLLSPHAQPLQVYSLPLLLAVTVPGTGTSRSQARRLKHFWGPGPQQGRMAPPTGLYSSEPQALGSPPEAQPQQRRAANSASKRLNACMVRPAPAALRSLYPQDTWPWGAYYTFSRGQSAVQVRSLTSLPPA